MGKLARRYTPGSNLANMSPEKRAQLAGLDEDLDHLADYLNRNVLLEESKRRPLTEEEQKRLADLIEKLERNK